MGGLGILLLFIFHDYRWKELLQGGPSSIWWQLLSGALYGFFSTQLMLVLIRRKVMDSTRHMFGDLMRRFKMRWIDIVLISLCAGVGEELLFRGAIQLWLGIWITAAVFVALHGYLDPRDKPVLTYGLFMVAVSAGFGYLTKEVGLWSAATAHTVVDILLMGYLRNVGRTQ
jgi:membrane protease YdiL (CAAX protease family)